MSSTASEECGLGFAAAQCSPRVRYRHQQQVVTAALQEAVASAGNASFRRLGRSPSFPVRAAAKLRPLTIRDWSK